MTQKTTIWTRHLELTEAEESVLVKMALHYVRTTDCNDVSKNDLDAVVEKLCDPSPFEYSVEEK